MGQGTCDCAPENMGRFTCGAAHLRQPLVPRLTPPSLRSAPRLALRVHATDARELLHYKRALEGLDGGVIIVATPRLCLVNDQRSQVGLELGGAPVPARVS